MNMYTYKQQYSIIVFLMTFDLEGVGNDDTQEAGDNL